MKKVIVIIALIIAPMLSGAQSIFDKYEDMKEVTSIVVTQKAFRMLATIDLDVDDPEAKEFMEMVKNKPWLYQDY